jgi:hypothetical protein
MNSHTLMKNPAPVIGGPVPLLTCPYGEYILSELKKRNI